jgi:uncharacterized protein YqgV (UPF0045/DUF77 family)
MASVRIEFLVEPFEEGAPGPHVRAAIDAASAGGADPEVGPFGTSVEADAGDAGALVGAIVQAALAKGATRVGIQVEAAAGRDAPPEQPAR